MKQIIFTAEVTPTPKGRPRFTRSGIAYTPQKTREYEAAVRNAYIVKYGHTLAFERLDALEVELHFAFAPPASWSKKKRLATLDEGLPNTNHIDIDNCIKSTLDACNGVVFADDSQITELRAVKYYADVPSVWVKITSAQRGRDR